MYRSGEDQHNLERGLEQDEYMSKYSKIDVTKPVYKVTQFVYSSWAVLLHMLQN